MSESDRLFEGDVEERERLLRLMWRKCLTDPELALSDQQVERGMELLDEQMPWAMFRTASPAQWRQILQQAADLLEEEAKKDDETGGDA